MLHFIYYYAKCHYAECRDAECRGTQGGVGSSLSLGLYKNVQRLMQRHTSPSSKKPTKNYSKARAYPS
jgi:hypothetical protein